MGRKNAMSDATSKLDAALAAADASLDAGLDRLLELVAIPLDLGPRPLMRPTCGARRTGWWRI